MGIKSLLPKFRDIENEISVEDLSGDVCAIDASTWIYQILMKYSLDLVQKRIDPRMYVNDFCNAIDVLVRHDVTPIVVFDGEELPAKQKTKKERKSKKMEEKSKALHYLDQKEEWHAKLCADRAVEVTPEIVDNIIQALDRKGIHWIQAPYEADAQLAYMALAGVVHYVISTDSDLLVYGTPKVIYKWNIHAGGGLLICNQDLHRCLSFPFTLRRFQIYCIITGCDYLESLRGVGPCLAERFMVSVANEDDVFQVFKMPIDKLIKLSIIHHSILPMWCNMLLPIKVCLPLH